MPSVKEIKRPSKLLLAILLFTVGFGSCEAKAEMERERRAALEGLRNGDISLLLAMDRSVMGTIARLDPASPFYAGLLVEESGDTPRAALLYEAALGSPIQKVTSEAARKLVPVLAETKDKEQAERILSFIAKDKNTSGEYGVLKNAALYALGRGTEISPEDGGRPFAANEKSGAAGVPPLSEVISEKAAAELTSWNGPFVFLSGVLRQKPGIIALNESRRFLFDYPVNAAYQWAFKELSALDDYVLPETEKVAALGRIAAAKRDYGEALAHFNTLRDSQLSLFFRYPELLADMGRSYIVSDREAGFRFFIEWENALRTGKNSPVNRGVSGDDDSTKLSAAELSKLRYTLLFYAGRIRRQQDRYEEASELFIRALPLAPDHEQKDAVIWYILSLALAENPDKVPALIRQYAGEWHRDNAFADILDRLSVYLITQNKWGEMADVFASIRNGKGGAIIARYAYLVGRAVDLGYLPQQNIKAADYFTVAYEQGDASFYYRALAASRLGKTVVLGNGKQNSKREQFPHANEMEFYLKFFEFGADEYAMAYMRENVDRYTPAELRALTETFAASERYLDSILIAGMYIYRDDYVMERADMELLYPKHFAGLIEKNARDNGLHPSVYFGLVRTESGFTPAIASHAGAVGLAQIMPATGREIAATIKRRGGPDYAADGDIDLTNPEINALFGAVYLKDLTNSMGSQMLALLAYNGGPSRIRRLRRAASSLPEDMFLETISIAETRNYGKRVAAAAAAYGYLYYNMPMHDVVSGIFR